MPLSEKSFIASLRVLLIVCLMLVVQSCASYGSHATSMRDGLLLGQPQVSLAIAEEKDSQHKEVISSLDKGMLRRINGDYAGSNRILEVAKQEIEKLYGISISENLAAVTINETLRGYTGDSYEQLLLHAYMAMNYIQLDDLDSARVEMAQADVKMQEWGENPRDDAFVRYLAGLIYERLNEPDQALVSYRKAYAVYKEKGGSEYPPLPLSLKKDLLRLTSMLGLKSEFDSYKREFSLDNYKVEKSDADKGELVVILNQGLAPIRGEASIYLFSSEVQQNLRVAFPVYKTPRQALPHVRLRVADKQVGLETVEDIDALARHALNEDMPGIMARATARAVVKYNTQHTAENKGSLAGFLMTVTNLVTERADTRSWTTLPQEIRLQRLRLPVGKHRVNIEIVNNAGYVVDSIKQDVEIQPGTISFLIKHWIAPVVRNKALVKPDTEHDNTKPEKKFEERAEHEQQSHSQAHE